MCDESNEAMVFRSKPVVVQAMQFDGTRESAEAICAWANIGKVETQVDCEYVAPDGLPARAINMRVHTSRGPIRARAWDWIIRGVEGEFYPCARSVFEQMYEQKGDPDA